MARAIDSEAAYRFLGEQLVKETGAFSKGVNKGLDIARSAMRNPDAIPTLRPVSREQVEQVWGGCEWCDEEWGTCNPITNRFTMPPRGGIRFCPMCGKPLTDEAVQMMMERMEALHETV